MVVQYGEHMVMVARPQHEQVPAALTALKGLDLRATTKSSLVGRDSALLAQLSRKGRVQVSVAIPALDRRTWLGMEPHAPSPERRLMAIGLLARAGVPAGVEV